ncbi:hypothetical protein [Syntrophomonas curvata]
MKRKKPYIPRPVLKNLADDIKKSVVSSEGCLSILDMVEDIPYDIRPQVVDGLSAFHEPAMVAFFYLLKAEYGAELAIVCDRVLEKYRMAGMDISPPAFFEGEFIKTYASASRHTGRMTLDVAWDTGGSGIHMECFYLTFNPDGIHSFFIIDNIPLEQYERDRKTTAEMVELNLEETCYLLYEAFNLNVTHMSRPALGRFMYQKYLDQNINQSYEWVKELMRKVSARLTPRQVINSFFNALSQNDFAYIFSIVSGRQLSPSLFLERFAELLNPDAMLLEGQANEVQGSRHTARVKAQTVRVENHKFYYSEYSFYLLYELGYWAIGDIERHSFNLVDPSSDQSPLSRQVLCRVFEIVDLEALFEVLDRVDNIREVEELPCGTHLRISYFDDNFNHGISFMSGVIADVVINGDELIVISQNRATIADIHDFLNSEPDSAVVVRGDYEISLMTAYTYLGGQYMSFEDLLFSPEEQNIYDDGMRFVTTRYLIKDRSRVLERLDVLKTLKIKLNQECTVYYQIVKESGGNNFLAEYLLGPNWVNVSTFGERDMSLARQEFEEQMYEYLEFDGMEVSNEGFFDVLTSDVKKEHPGLEPALKDIYLDKWYHSHLLPLSGMSPFEACQTEEGSRLLWAMFKNLKQKSKTPCLQYRKNIDLKEYIRKVEQKKEGKQ